jgi:hypothetical protein
MIHDRFAAGQENNIFAPWGSRSAVELGIISGRIEENETKKEDETSSTPSISSSTIPLTSGIEEAPQLLLLVTKFLPHLSTSMQVAHPA